MTRVDFMTQSQLKWT